MQELPRRQQETTRAPEQAGWGTPPGMRMLRDGVGSFAPVAIERWELWEILGKISRKPSTTSFDDADSSSAPLRKARQARDYHRPQS